MENTAGATHPPRHPASARPSLHDMVLEHPGPLPYIWRNLVKWHGGKSNPDAASLHLPNGHDAGLPPHKRRRLSASASTPPTVPTLAIASERRGAPYEEPPSSATYLKLDVSGVAHRDTRALGPVARNGGEVSMRCPATCRVSLYQGQTLFDRVLHCQSLPCEVIISKTAVGTYGIVSIEPPPSFLIPKHALNVVNRNGAFGLNHAYLITFDLEAGNGPRWPPLSLTEMGLSPMGEVYPRSILRGSTRDLVGDLALPIHLIPDFDAPLKLSLTNLVMKVNTRWVGDAPSLPLPSQSLPTPDNTTESPQRPTTSSAFAESLIHRSVAIADEDDDDQMDTDGAPTPSRSLRTRRTAVGYNLKDLSDKALGRSGRRSSQLPPVSLPRPDQLCWVMPGGQSVWLDANRCIACTILYKNFNQLIDHLETAHLDLKYEPRVSRQGHTIHVFNNFKISLTPPSKELHFVRSKKRIDVQAYTEGDKSWLSYSYEEEPEEEVRTPRRKRHVQAVTPVTKRSRSSPQQLHGQKRRRPLVPDIPDTALYHPVSKQLLTPGEELPRPAPDKQWILQKYREALREFSDIAPEEREYMFKWDTFLQPLNITTAEHLPEIWLAFVDKHADWLVDQEHRMLEFGKHAALLFGRSLIKSSANVTRRLDVARRLKQDRELQNGAANGANNEDSGPAAEDDISKSPRQEYVKQGATGCYVCKLPVRGPRQLLCTGDACLRIFHSTCVESTAKMPVTSRKWRCDSCLIAQTTS